MSEEKNGAGAEPKPLQEIIDSKPPIADYTDSLDREESHREAREERDRPQRERKPKGERPQVPEGYVPLREVLDERERRQKYETEAQAYRRMIDEHNAKIKADEENEPAPDMFKDPKGYNEWVQRQVQRQASALAEKELAPLRQQITTGQIQLSAMRTQSTIGPERWAKLNEWINTQKQADPGFEKWAIGTGDPYAAAWAEYKRASTFERLGDDDLETYLEKQKQEWLKSHSATPPPQRFEADPDSDDDDEDEPQRRPVPKSFAASRDAKPRDDSGRYAGPKPLGELVREKQSQPRHRR